MEFCQISPIPHQNDKVPDHPQPSLKLGRDQSTDPDDLTPKQTLTAISKRVHELAAEQHLCFLNTILSQLSTEGIPLVQPEEMSGEQERFLEEFFQRTLYPIVTPMAIDPAFPVSSQPFTLLDGFSGQPLCHAYRIPIFPSCTFRPKSRRALFPANA